MPSKSTPFTPSSILFRPRWWSRRVLPPGPIGLLRRPFIAIAGLRRHLQYKHRRLTKKDRVGHTRPPKELAPTCTPLPAPSCLHPSCLHPTCTHSRLSDKTFG